jgi:UDP-N-acetylglucosamine 2-epimerase (non-hydrolysing)
MKILCVFGTRPEAIKMCPVIKELKKHPELQTIVCLTGQHKEMLDQVMDVFNIKADYNLDIMRPKQNLTTITVSVLEGLEQVLSAEKPGIVLVHGDTSTSFAAALASFYQQIPVGHVEAGLRTYNKYSPYPEEMNRCLTGRITELHFATTVNNKTNLEKEGITRGVFVTGNTVIDAFNTTIKEGYAFKVPLLNDIDFKKNRVILVTAHRRENLGGPLVNICNALDALAKEYSDVIIIYPVHLNPAVREPVNKILGQNPRIKLIDPIDVEDMHNIISRSYLVLTDSGGLQEEAPSCGIPVLVMRTETERPEAVEAGTVKVVGVETQAIYNAAKDLLEDKAKYSKMAQAVNPYGDGHASERIVKILLDFAAGKA